MRVSQLILLIILLPIFIGQSIKAAPPELVRVNTFIDSSIIATQRFVDFKGILDDKGAIHLFYPFHHFNKKYLLNYLRFSPDGKIDTGPEMKLPPGRNLRGYGPENYPKVIINDSIITIVNLVDPTPNKKDPRQKCFIIASDMKKKQEFIASKKDAFGFGPMRPISNNRIIGLENRVIGMGWMGPEYQIGVVIKEANKKKPEFIPFDMPDSLTGLGGMSEDIYQLNEDSVLYLRAVFTERHGGWCIEKMTFNVKDKAVEGIEIFPLMDSISFLMRDTLGVAFEIQNHFYNIDDNLVFMTPWSAGKGLGEIKPGSGVLVMDKAGRIIPSDSVQVRDAIYMDLQSIAPHDVIIKNSSFRYNSHYQSDSIPPTGYFVMVSFRNFPNIYIDIGR